MDVDTLYVKMKSTGSSDDAKVDAMINRYMLSKEEAKKVAFATEKKATRHLNKNGDAVILNESLVEKGKKPIVETEALYQWLQNRLGKSTDEVKEMVSNKFSMTC